MNAAGNEIFTVFELNEFLPHENYLLYGILATIVVQFIII